MYDKVNPLYREIYGVDMPRILLYAPTRYHHGENTPEIATFGGSTNTSGSTASFMHQRVNHKARMRQENALTVYWQHMSDVANFLNDAQMLREIRGVLTKPEVRDAITQKFGPAIWEEAKHGKSALGAVCPGFCGHVENRSWKREEACQFRRSAKEDFARASQAGHCIGSRTRFTELHFRMRGRDTQSASGHGAIRLKCLHDPIHGLLVSLCGESVGMDVVEILGQDILAVNFQRAGRGMRGGGDEAAELGHAVAGDCVITVRIKNGFRTCAISNDQRQIDCVDELERDRVRRYRAGVAGIALLVCLRGSHGALSSSGSKYKSE